MSKVGIYPGSFDPVTYGHLDIIDRGSRIFDKLYIAVSNNINKHYLFNATERKELLEMVTEKYTNIEIVICDKLSAEFANDLNATSLLRGLRAITDFEYEMQMAATNSVLYPKIETIFLMSRTENSFLSSSVVKEVARYHGDISRFVPKAVESFIIEKFRD